MAVRKISHAYRAIRPDGAFLLPGWPDPPTWSGEHFSEDQVMALRDEHYPGWTLEVEVTTVHEWEPVFE